MIEHPKLYQLGRMAIFFLPQEKLLLRRGPNETTIREYVEDRLLHHYNGYTSISGEIIGCWKNGRRYDDVHVRYEVSFPGRERIQHFVDFLSEVCGLLEEESIYLTMGEDSYLVMP